MRHLDLGQLCKRANQVIRATVLDVRTGTLEAGGGKIPTVTYRLRVRESLAGSPLNVIDVTMLGAPKEGPPQGDVRRLEWLNELPRLEQGQEYLLFTTTPSRAGLVTFVGSGQGCFKIFTRDKTEYAMNTINNRGLGINGEGPVAYAELAKRIRNLRAK